MGCKECCGFCASHDEYMWWCGNDDEFRQDATVGSKLANGFGLHDMHGGVLEWVQDWHAGHLGNDPQTDPTGPPVGTSRVWRGGGWGFCARDCRSAKRGDDVPGGRESILGFRLARTSQ